MTNEEAHAKAQKLFGQNAYVRFDSRLTQQYEVNPGDGGDNGVGGTWEAAFAQLSWPRTTTEKK